MPIVEITPEADEDVFRLWRHIAMDSPDNATSYVRKIDASFQTRATMPLSGRSRPEIREGLRSYPYDNYVVYYEPIIDGIRVIRLLHAARDVDDIFNIH